MTVYVLTLRIDYENDNPDSTVVGVYKNQEDAERELEESVIQLCEENEINYEELLDNCEIFDGDNYYFYDIYEMELQ